ncbi:MAG: hypothetical protein FWG33_04065, partial [Oscillospiraceae bacterium]|nr:hypothetical protein [Oscillospiraceae bacterium]
MEQNHLNKRTGSMSNTASKVLPPMPVFDSADTVKNVTKPIPVVNKPKPTDNPPAEATSEKVIMCPYCFEEFSHSSVWFRMETVFESEEDCDPHKLGRLKEEIELLGDKAVLEKFEQNKCFLSGESEKYRQFWSRFSGGSGEKATTNKEGREIEIPPQKRPVLPVNSPMIKFTKTSDEGILYSARDIYGIETTRRICPECHNPLPAKYG